MQHSEREWNALNQQIQSLREENAALKRRIQQLQKGNHQQEEEDFIRSTVHATFKNSSLKLQKKNTENGAFRFGEKTKEQLRTQLQNWSQKLNINLFQKKELQIRRTHSSQSKDNITSLQALQDRIQFGLLDKLCLFGPNQSKTLEMKQKRAHLPHQLYFPQTDKHFSLYESYGFSLYPDQVQVKAVRQKNKNIEVDRVIFRKSLKHSDCKLIIFQSKQEFCLPHDKIMRQYNPFSTVYCVSLDFLDYLYSERPFVCLDKNSSFTEDRFQQFSCDKGQKVDSVLAVPQSLRRQKSVYGQNSVFKSTFCISIMSYYPLLDFFCEFLLQIINHIKIKRIEEHSNSAHKYQHLDIKYVIEQLKDINSKFKHLFYLKFDYGSKIQYKLGQSNIKLSVQNLREEMSRGWAYRMLRLLDKDVLYEIYAMVLQEQSIVFFSENSYMLTFMIYLFVGLLIHPFSYPHTIVSSIFQIDHLQTPFIAIMGLNKSNKWLLQNEDYLVQKMVGKVLVHVNEDQTKIKFKKKSKYAKSERLKKIFNSFYKKVEKLEGTLKHKDILTRQITKAENDITLQLLADLDAYYNQQLLKYMPAREIIESIRKELNASSDNQSTVSVKLIKTIQHYIIESRNNIQKDPMIDSLLQRQIFSVYLTIKYDIL